MREFARLYFEIDASTSTSAKLAALKAYFEHATAADAAWSVYFLGGAKPRQVVPVKVLRALAVRTAAIPDWLFEESYQAVGDLAETIALLLPAAPTGTPPEDRSLAQWITDVLLPLRTMNDADREAALLAAWAALDVRGRFLAIKLITGGFRVGISRLLVTRALAQAAGLEPKLVAERLMGDWRPSAAAYQALVEPAGAERVAARGHPYPFFLAHQLDRDPAELGAIEDWQAEWKWDGIRAQLVWRDGARWLWSRGDELVTERFPELAAAAPALPAGTVLDGEIVAWRGESALPFAVLQRRIGRKVVGAKTLMEAPCIFLAYDLLEAHGLDLRAEPLTVRRAQLESTIAAAASPVLRVSSVLSAIDWPALATQREQSRNRFVEGLMLKHRASAYGVGRVKLAGHGWWKWKIDPLSVDAVLVYAQRGHGRRASLYTDYTFAVWSDGALVPFAKAYSGLTDAEFRKVDAFITKNTVEKFGPVRAVKPELVFEIGFEGIQASSRHKSGIAVRFPRMLRMREDKRPVEADSIAALHRLMQAPA